VTSVVFDASICWIISLGDTHTAGHVAMTQPTVFGRVSCSVVDALSISEGQAKFLPTMHRQ